MRMLIISGKTALHKQIGSTTAVEQEIKSFIKLKKGIHVNFVYYDQDNQFKIKKVPKNARKIKGLIDDIEKQWGIIDILLILGGDDVVPFFRLDNPCDDDDPVVISDNPYASRDDDFLVPERVCSRIPDNQDALFMIKQLKKSPKKAKSSFGICAKDWEEASIDVYQHVGNKRTLKTSPPVKSSIFKNSWLQKRNFLYFNLHGSKVTNNWYGQGAGTYPIAVSTANIKKAAGIVGAECCYGAYILKKTSDSALVLKILNEEDIYGFCGSTTIAYGPATPPSTEADLIVKYFFQYAKQGLTLGESFRNAKLDFCRKVLRRQGFLDDDDQKTLLQFVLYGDPTLSMKTKSKRKRIP